MTKEKFLEKQIAEYRRLLGICLYDLKVYALQTIPDGEKIEKNPLSIGPERATKTLQKISTDLKRMMDEEDIFKNS